VCSSLSGSGEKRASKSNEICIIKIVKLLCEWRVNGKVAVGSAMGLLTWKWREIINVFGGGGRGFGRRRELDGSRT
jgi:hypothetical protein